MAAGSVSSEGWHRLGSSWRQTDPARTLVVAQGLAARLGISRVTDITRLDRLGLPVFASVRPRGRALCVHAGKGMRTLEAQVGAWMEAIEFSAAEAGRSRWQPHTLTLAQVEHGFGGRFALQDFAPVIGSAGRGDERVCAVACEDLGAGGPCALPAALVFVPGDEAGGSALFAWSTTGLASGNTLQEATLHGLLEVLERDALSMNLALDGSCWIDPAQLPPPFAELCARWQDQGVRLALRYVPNDFGLPCFDALLYDEHGSVVNLAGGSGLHLDRGIALTRAVCEAAQSRLTQIHGGRDDILPAYRKFSPLGSNREGAAEARLVAQRFDTVRRIALADVPDVARVEGGLDGALKALLQRLRERGFPTVLRHRFDIDLDGLQVVRVVVPRCENLDLDRRRIGPRLLARVVGRG